MMAERTVRLKYVGPAARIEMVCPWYPVVGKTEGGEPIYGDPEPAPPMDDHETTTSRANYLTKAFPGLFERVPDEPAPVAAAPAAAEPERSTRGRKEAD
jgi:hypothetical protein